MKPELQRIAIAEACGWKWRPIGDTIEWLQPKPYSPPHYLSDLNAMHEAEEVLTPDQKAEYAFTLHGMHGMPLATFWHRVICSNAAQRAEAFLRTIGKWTD